MRVEGSGRVVVLVWAEEGGVGISRKHFGEEPHKQP